MDFEVPPSPQSLFLVLEQRPEDSISKAMSSVLSVTAWLEPLGTQWVLGGMGMSDVRPLSSQPPASYDRGRPTFILFSFPLIQNVNQAYVQSIDNLTHYLTLAPRAVIGTQQPLPRYKCWCVSGLHYTTLVLTHSVILDLGL